MKRKEVFKLVDECDSYDGLNTIFNSETGVSFELYYKEYIGFLVGFVKIGVFGMDHGVEINFFGIFRKVCKRCNYLEKLKKDNKLYENLKLVEQRLKDIKCKQQADHLYKQCKNCGAVTKSTLSKKYCPYCGSGI